MPTNITANPSTTGAGTVQTTSGGLLVQVSKKFSLIWANYVKAFYLAVIVPLILEVLTGLQSGNFKPNWAALGTAFISTAAAYLMHAYFTTTATVVQPTPANLAAAK